MFEPYVVPLRFRDQALERALLTRNVPWHARAGHEVPTKVALDLSDAKLDQARCSAGKVLAASRRA